MVGAGKLIEILFGIPYYSAVMIVVGLMISWPLARFFYVFYYIDIKTIYKLVLAFCVFMTLYLGHMDHVLVYYVVISTILAGVGYLLRNYNTMPLIFVFMMQDGIEENLGRLLFYL